MEGDEKIEVISSNKWIIVVAIFAALFFALLYNLAILMDVINAQPNIVLSI
ncbi:MAG: hypothetical protein KGZ30_00395 [Anaplasmataceae bacterium]|nr:hypothetical protein [Anaplasmataceae bacterium]